MGNKFVIYCISIWDTMKLLKEKGKLSALIAKVFKSIVKWIRKWQNRVYNRPH